jgi:hypothetical protein
VILVMVDGEFRTSGVMSLQETLCMLPNGHYISEQCGVDGIEGNYLSHKGNFELIAEGFGHSADGHACYHTVLL